MKTVRILSLTLLISVLLSACALSSSEKNEETTYGGAGREISTSDENKTAETEKISNDVRLSFAAVGDNIVHESIFLEAQSKAEAQASAGGAKVNYTFESMYEDDVRDVIKNADISFVNQEGPIAGGTAFGYPNFNAPTEAGDELCNMGFDIVNIANNHMLDMEHRTTGYENTISYWKSKDVLTVGGYENKADYETVRYIEKDGVKIAVLSFTYGTNGYTVNSSSEAVVPYIDDDVIKSRIASAKGKCDLIFVSMHWGTENSESVNSEQKRLAKLISDAGADVIIGHHSHTVQPIEWVTGQDGNKTLVIYSLGNFISTQIKAINLVGIIATFDIVKNEGEDAYIENVKAIPTVTVYDSDTSVMDSQNLATRYNVSVKLFENYTAAEAKNHGVNAWDTFDYDSMSKKVQATVGSEFLG